MADWFRFADPGRLWFLLLIPVVIVGYVIALKLRQRISVRYPNATLLAEVTPKQSQWRRHLAVALSLLSLAALTVAWARPQGIEMVPRERATVVMVIDHSRSMAATDVKPTRFEAAKTAGLTFLDALPKQFNVAIVGLSGNPTVRLAPTTDRAQARAAINSMKLADSTAIGESIYSALAAIDMAPAGSTPAPGAIVVLSDGDNTTGRSPKQAAQEAAGSHVPIYTIAFGTENGYVDLDGKRQRVPPNPALLAELSKISGGTAFQANDLNGLNKVYTNIRSEVGQVAMRKEVTAQWAGYGLAFAVVAALAAVSLGARWP